MPVVLAIAVSLRCFSCSAFHLASSALDCFFGMMHRAGWLGANLSQFALVDAVRHDGFCGVFAGFELRAHRLFFGRGLLWPDFGVLVARQRRAAFLLLAVGRADLHELGFRRNGLGNMGIDLRVVAVWVGASVLPYVRKQELVMPCPLGAVHATPRCRDKLRVPLVEGSEFEDEEDVALNPELETPDREKDAFRLLPAVAPILFEASSKRLFLLVGLELCQQERMADADLLAVEGFDHDGSKLGQLQPASHIRGRLACSRCDLLNGVFRLFQVQQSAEAVGFLHRVNVAALEVFNQLRLQRFGVGEVLDTNGDSGGFGHLRGAVTPRSEDDLKALFAHRPHKQGRKNALGADALGQFLQGIILEGAARVGLGFSEQRERQVAVLGGVGDGGGVHGDGSFRAVALRWVL